MTTIPTQQNLPIPVPPNNPHGVEKDGAISCGHVSSPVLRPVVYSGQVKVHEQRIVYLADLCKYFTRWHSCGLSKFYARGIERSGGFVNCIEVRYVTYDIYLNEQNQIVRELVKEEYYDL